MRILKQLHHILIDGLWCLLLFGLPITSFPYYALVGVVALISPFSALPLLLLMVIWLPLELWKNKRIPYDIIPLVLFFLAAGFSTALAFFLPLSPFKGTSQAARGPRALLTLVEGISFYLVTVMILKKSSHFRMSFKAVNLGAVMMFVYTLVQAWYVFVQDGNFSGWYTNLHHMISMRDPVWNRLNAMAYEPSWFAHQLSMFYFPLWIGLITNGKSAFRKRGLLSLETLLLLTGIVLIFLAKSRIGLISMMVMFFVLVLRASWLIFRWILGITEALFREKLPAAITVAKVLTTTVLLVVALAITVQVALAALRIAQELDPRMKNIFSDTGLPGLKSGLQYIFSPQFGHTMQFVERLAYWQAGWKIFEQYPFLGVGLGNAGFLFPEAIPSYSWRYLEITRVLHTDPYIFPNIKNLWIRLLAETGVAGFSIFVSWLMMILMQAVALFKKQERLKRTIGTAGILGTITILTEGFSIDSFAFPYFWILFGMVTAAYHLPSKKEKRISNSEECKIEG